MILYKIGTYAVVRRRKRYHHWQFTNISARIPLQSRFLGSPNIFQNHSCIQANRKLDSFPPGEAIFEIELRRLYPKYASFNIQKVGAITVLSVGSVVLCKALIVYSLFRLIVYTFGFLKIRLERKHCSFRSRRATEKLP